MILMSAVKRISNDFSILKEARREVLEDLMDIENTKKIVEGIETKKIKLEEIHTNIPSPFAFNLVAQGITDIMKIEDRVEFIRRMHKNVLAKIGLKKGKKDKEEYAFTYNEFWKKTKEKLDAEKDEKKEKLKMMAWNIKKVPMYAKEEIVRMIDGDEDIREDVLEAIEKYKKDIKKNWPKELSEFVFEKIKKMR